jgi:hypothetical protein
MCQSYGVADPAKIGTVWQDDDLDAIVEDYFEMLLADLEGKTYVKAHHGSALMEKIGRTHKAVEFKHQNISAVLDELGLPWIPGYIPKRNYQQAIFPAIDRYLSAHPGILGFVPAKGHPSAKAPDVFVARPSLTESQNNPKELQRLVRKFDPVERDHRNRALGSAGEAFVVEIERGRLAELGRKDLAKEVRWVSLEDGDGAGYDILSFASSGQEKLIEVKTTNGSARTPFFLSRNECEVASERPGEWCIYRVHLFARNPRIFEVSPPLETTLTLRAETWRASFNSATAST